MPPNTKPPTKPAAGRAPRTYTRPVCDVKRHDNVVSVSGRLQGGDFKKVLAAIHQTIAVAGHNDLVLDFSYCTSASPGCMLPICASAAQLRNNHHSIDLTLPVDDRMRRLFLNANWSHLIAPRTFDPSHKVIGGQGRLQLEVRHPASGNVMRRWAPNTLN